MTEPKQKKGHRYEQHQATIQPIQYTKCEQRQFRCEQTELSGSWEPKQTTCRKHT